MAAWSTICSLFLILSTILQSSDGQCLIGCQCSYVDGRPDVKCSALSELPKRSDIPENVAFLSVEKSDIRAISQNSLDFNSLVSLSLVDCNISSISDGSFSNLSSLMSLDLSSNQLSFESFAPNLFNSLTSLHHLRLKNNHLDGTVPVDFLAGMKNLTSVDFSHNNKIQFDDSQAFLGLGIKMFSCESCGIRNISDVTYALDGAKLHSLYLSRNNIPNIESESFSNVLNLEWIDLSNCGIENISPAAFSGLKNLNYLYLNGNKVSGTTVGMISLSSTKTESSAELHLEGNGFTSLPPAVGNLSSKLYLGNNPWRCDCNIAWMRTVKTKIVNVSYIVCVTPVAVAGISVVEFEPPAQCRCLFGADCGSHTAVALGILVPVLIICAAIVSCFIYRYVKNRRRRSREKKAFRYSAVYRETVELSNTGGKQPTPLIDDMRI